MISTSTLKVESLSKLIQGLQLTINIHELPESPAVGLGEFPARSFTND
jgi:hypothetical protein